MTVVAARNLIKKYGNFTAVDKINFTIEKGECFGLLGPNGAGKTTTISMIYCFYPVTSGELRVFNMDVRSEYRKIKHRLGVVPQDNNLDPDLSVLDNLVIYAGYYGIPRREARKRALELLDFFSLSEKNNVEVDRLSGGMKRRLVIARALINNPELLILDEPTTGLDPEARHLIWQRLKELKKSGMTLILTTHYLEEAAQLCDRLVFMDRGKILAEGSPRQLVEKYIGFQVVEVTPPQETFKDVVHLASRYDKGYQKVGSSLFIYPDDKGEEVVDALKSLGLTYHLLRPANLEDVFLKLTGRGLE